MRMFAKESKIQLFIKMKLTTKRLNRNVLIKIKLTKIKMNLKNFKNSSKKQRKHDLQNLIIGNHFKKLENLLNSYFCLDWLADCLYILYSQNMNKNFTIPKKPQIFKKF